MMGGGSAWYKIATRCEVGSDNRRGLIHPECARGPYGATPPLARLRDAVQISAMKKLLQELEEMVVDAWPAPETEELDGWLLRASGGPSRRGNSVATLAASGELTLEERIARAEAWYRERGQAPVFQVGPCAAPRELEQALISASYVKHSESALAVATPAQVAAQTQRSMATRLDVKPSEAWLKIAVGQSRFVGTDEVFRGFLQRLGSRVR